MSNIYVDILSGHMSDINSGHMSDSMSDICPDIEKSGHMSDIHDICPDICQGYYQVRGVCMHVKVTQAGAHMKEELNNDCDVKI